MTGTLTAQQSAALEESLRAFEERNGTQIAVLIMPTTRPEAIEPFALRVVEQWKLGRRKIDDGALLLVAKDPARVPGADYAATRCRTRRTRSAWSNRWRVLWRY